MSGGPWYCLNCGYPEHGSEPCETPPTRFPHDDFFVSDTRKAQPERQHGDRFIETRPSHLATVPRTNHPEEIDLYTYTPEERDQLARAALWLATYEHDSRFLETVTGVLRHLKSELETLLRIRLTVFVEDVCDVLRQRGERLRAEAEDKASAF